MVLGLSLLLYVVFFVMISLLFFDQFWVIDVMVLKIFNMTFGAVFVFDFFSLFFICVVSVVAASIFLWGVYYMDSDKFQKGFIIILFCFVLSMFFMVLSPNLFFLLLGWDGLGVTSYFLVVYYSSLSSSSAGMLTFMTNRLGDVFFLFSICGLGYVFSWDFFSLFYVGIFVGLFMCISFFTKSAQFPFSSWLPAAMAAPTPVSSLVHSSTLVTAGVFLLIRFYSVLEGLFFYLFVLSVMTLLGAGFVALFEWDMKKIIAFSTLSQLGFMVVSYSMGLLMVCFFHLLSHAFFKSCLFMCSGVVIHNSRDSQEFRNSLVFIKFSPLLAMGFAVCLLCLSGFPFLSGFFSKDMILDSMNVGFFIFSLYLFSVLLTVVYSSRVFFYVLLTSMKFRVSFFSSYINLVFNYVPMFFLLFLSVVVGLFWNEMMFFVFPILFVSFGWKFFYLFLLVSVFVLSFVFINFFYKYLKSYFFSSVFFLNSFMGSFLFSWVLWGCGVIVSLLDAAWMEMYGPQRVHYFISSMGLKFFSVFSSMFIGFLFCFVMFFCLLF